jgi:ribosomal protein L17
VDLLDPVLIAKIFGDAVSSEFAKTLAIFTAAAWVHSQRVAKEIKAQVGALITVVKEDLDAQKRLSEHIILRVQRLEVLVGNVTPKP